MSRLLHTCSLICPLMTFLIPRRWNSQLNAWDSNQEVSSVAIEMGDLAMFEGQQNEMEVFNRVDDDSVDEPFDPAIDHFRVLSQYSPQKKLLIVSILEAGGDCDVARCSSAQVRMALLSDKDKVIKKHTDYACGPNPKFNKTFAFKLDEEKLQTSVLRFRLYKKRMPRRNQLVGEAYLKGCKVGPHSIHLLKIRPPIVSSGVKRKTDLLAIIESGDVVASRIAESVQDTFAPLPIKAVNNHPALGKQSSTSSVANGKVSNKLMTKISRINTIEILVNLAYSDVQNSFRVGIDKVANMEKLMESDNKPLECYFQLIIRSDGAELCRHRTKIINCASEISLDEFVVVPASLREIHDITVIIGFFCLQGFLKKQTLLGWIRFGADEIESADAADHWTQMINDIGRSVERWHTLRRPLN